MNCAGDSKSAENPDSSPASPQFLTKGRFPPRRVGMIQVSTPCRVLFLSILPTLAFFTLAAPIARAEFKVGLVLDRGGKDDKSFNSSAYVGAMQAKTNLGVLVKYVEATDDNAFEPLMRGFAQRDFDLIIGIGFAQKEATAKAAAQFPKTHFAIVDAQVEAPNVRSLMFEEHEGAFLVGAIAALTSKTGKIGFVGGMDIPLIRRFALGTRRAPGTSIPRSALWTIMSASRARHGTIRRKAKNWAWRNTTAARISSLRQPAPPGWAFSMRRRRGGNW